ncbi:MAG: hypothetical protein WA418_24460 [Bradyrhizobium sp.]
MSSTPSKPRENLAFSADGKFLLDTAGNKVLQLVESVGGFVPMQLKDKSGRVFDAATAKMEINWVWEDVCMLYDENMNCLQSYRRYVPDWAVPENK